MKRMIHYLLALMLATSVAAAAAHASAHVEPDIDQCVLCANQTDHPSTGAAGQMLPIGSEQSRLTPDNLTENWSKNRFSYKPPPRAPPAYS